jgi:outer membrane protein W
VKLRNLAVVALIGTLVSGNAQAEEGLDAGWNAKHGLLFQVQNVFSDGNGILNEYAGGVGAQYNLAPNRAIRASVSLSRTSNPPFETETQTAGGPVVKQDVIPAITSSIATTVRGSYVHRLSLSAIAPYLGVGASIQFASSGRDGTDDDTTGTKIEYEDTERAIVLGLVGQLGLEWRVHRTVSIFAEYGLQVNALDRRSSSESTTVNGVRTKSEYTQTRFLNVSTGLDHGAELGLIAFF